MLDWKGAARYDGYPGPISESRHNYAHGLHEIHAVALMKSEALQFSMPIMVTVLLVVKDGPIFTRVGTARITHSDWLGLQPDWSLVTLG